MHNCMVTSLVRPRAGILMVYRYIVYTNSVCVLSVCTIVWCDLSPDLC